MPTTDATRQLILDCAGQFDMLFFASGEPTIHPKLFEHVELAKSVGFTSFGMSSHFRTFADPRFALKTLQAGFEYFDISLHAADLTGQLDVNPIGDDGESLYEALKGLAMLFRLADALGIRISITQKIVVSRLNVTQLEPIFRATYDRGVRHFIVQPVRDARASRRSCRRSSRSREEEMLPHLNELLRKTEGLGADDQAVRLLAPEALRRHPRRDRAEPRQERLRQGPRRASSARPAARATKSGRPTAATGSRCGRRADERFGFASDGSAPILDDGARARRWTCRSAAAWDRAACAAPACSRARVDQSTQIFLTEEQQSSRVTCCSARRARCRTSSSCVHGRRDRSAVTCRSCRRPP